MRISGVYSVCCQNSRIFVNAPRGDSNVRADNQSSWTERRRKGDAMAGLG